MFFFVLIFFLSFFFFFQSKLMPTRCNTDPVATAVWQDIARIPVFKSLAVCPDRDLKPGTAAPQAVGDVSWLLNNLAIHHVRSAKTIIRASTLSWKL